MRSKGYSFETVIAVVITIICIFGVYTLLKCKGFMMVEDDTINWYSIINNIRCDNIVDYLPKKVDSINFIAYVEHDGSSSDEVSYMIVDNLSQFIESEKKKEGYSESRIYAAELANKISMYKRAVIDGKERFYKNDDVSEKYIYDKLSHLEVKDLPKEVDSGTLGYGELYFRENGKVYKCITNKIF